MTILDLLRLLVRRWPVVLAGLALTAWIVPQVTREASSYSATTTVNVLAPDVKKERILGWGSADAISVANVLAARVNGGVPDPLASSPDVPLSAAGVTRGVHATVRNEGGQWKSSVNEPIVQVQVVDPEKSQVMIRMDEEIQRIREELTKLEDEMSVPARSRIQLEVNPARPVVATAWNYPARAMVGYGAFGLGATVAAAVWADSLLAGRRRSGRGRPAAVVPAQGVAA